MVRWRYAIVLALLLLLPVKIAGKPEEDDEEDSVDESEEDGEDEDEDNVEEQSDKKRVAPGRRAPAVFPVTTKSTVSVVTRTEKKKPLECYVCAFKTETLMKSCLDPAKFRVHTVTCPNPEDKCFTSIMMSKHNAYETVMRGCRSNCVGTPDTTCCESNRCNHQALAMPLPTPKALVKNKSDKTMQPTVLFFVTILLVLQTVVRVAMV